MIPAVRDPTPGVGREIETELENVATVSLSR
jgi:hypothetical protein